MPLASVSWPILERIPIVGDLAISPHGLGIAFGFVFGAVLMIRRSRLRGLGHEPVPDLTVAVQELLTRAAIGAIVGSRLFYVLTHIDQYAQDPLAILEVWEGGLTFLGGLAGAIIAAYPVMRRRGYRPAQVLDSSAPGVALGLVFGRLGDLIIGDHIGDPAPGFPLAWRCTGNLWDAATNSFAFSDPIPPEAYSAVGAAPTQGCFDVAMHQTALYDFISAGLLLVLILFLERRPRWDGFFVATYVYWYGSFRFLVDFLREDRRWFGLTPSQYVVLAAMVAVTVFIRWKRPWEAAPWAWDPPDFATPWRQERQEPAEQAVAAGGQEDPDRGE